MGFLSKIREAFEFGLDFSGHKGKGGGESQRRGIVK